MTTQLTTILQGLANILGAREARREIRGKAHRATFRGSANIGDPVDDSFGRLAAANNDPRFTFSRSAR